MIEFLTVKEAIKKGNLCLIPVDAVKLVDGRTIEGERNEVFILGKKSI